MEFDTFLAEYSQHLEDVEWLSQAIIILSASLYTHNSQMADAQLEEVKVATRYLLEFRDKKMSVSEADKHAIVDTNNHYTMMKVQGEAIIETIQAIKKRLEILVGEKKYG